MAFKTAIEAKSLFIEDNTAERTPFHLEMRREFSSRRIDAAGEGKLYTVHLIFQKIINHLDHFFYGHGFFRHDDAAFLISRSQFRLERGTFYFIEQRPIPDILLFIHL